MNYLPNICKFSAIPTMICCKWSVVYLQRYARKGQHNSNANDRPSEKTTQDGNKSSTTKAANEISTIE